MTKNKILIPLIVLFLTIPAVKSLYSMPNIYIDAYGILRDMGEGVMKFGGGGNVGIAITDDINILYVFNYTLRPMEPLLTTKRTYTNILYGLQVEYVFPIKAYRLGWKTGITLGMATSDVSFENLTDQNVNDMGIHAGLNTGIQYDLTQHITPFFELGYAYTSFLNQLSGADMHNFNLNLGVRLTIGSNQSIEEGY
ncbi:MAG: outer membrane beta-barrel protein [bacterium]|nr:outer membrane beta-barrel protein [bacterium]